MSPTRRDWHGEPEAPAVNSLKPSAGTFVLHEGRLLLIERSDNGNWCMPGGAMDLGESMSDCAVRETLEETGVNVRLSGIVGIFSDPGHRIEYLSDGEVRQEFTVIYRAEYVSGTPTTSSESKRAEWVPLPDVEGLTMDNSQRHRITWGLRHSEPWIDPSGEDPAWRSQASARRT